MIVDGLPGPHRHLTYCTNIHRGETWPAVLENLRTHVLDVKGQVSPHHPFGVGLRLSAAAARGLAEADALVAFQEFLRANDLYVFTINGFPHGTFSGTVVKEQVYRPDWLEDERVRYSDQLAQLLAALLPPELEGTVSTVPGCFLERGTLASAGAALAANLRRHAVALWRLRETTGRTVALALEPEPHCAIETTAQAAAFFTQQLWSASSLRAFAGATGVASPGAAEEILRRHVGVCLDACHAAVEFEDPTEAVARLTGAGVRILKVQVSAGLRVPSPDAEALAALARFAEDVYLHQVVIRAGEWLSRFVDLPAALAQARAAGTDERAGLGDEWRVHFHVPLFREQLGRFTNTANFLRPLLAALARRDDVQQYEVETYTWDVLPPEYRNEPVVDAVARELRWTLAALRPEGVRP